MKLYYALPLFLLLFSCASTLKVKELEADTTQAWSGSVREVVTTATHFIYKKNDTVTEQSSSKIIFDRKNKPLQQIDIYGDNVDTSLFKYTAAGLIKSQITTGKDSTSLLIQEYEYDDHGNAVVYKSSAGKKPELKKTMRYDAKNNLTEVFFDRLGTEPNSTEKIEYDYKAGKKTTTTFDDKMQKEIVLEVYFNKKGWITATEVFSGNASRGSDTLEYDKKGNLVKRSIFDGSKKLVRTFTYQNSYDAKGNILQRDNFDNGRLLDRTTNQIKYW